MLRDVAMLRAARSDAAKSRAAAATSTWGTARRSSGGAKLAANPRITRTTSNSSRVKPRVIAHQLPIAPASSDLPFSPHEKRSYSPLLPGAR